MIPSNVTFIPTSDTNTSIIPSNTSTVSSLGVTNVLLVPVTRLVPSITLIPVTIMEQSYESNNNFQLSVCEFFGNSARILPPDNEIVEEIKHDGLFGDNYNNQIIAYPMVLPQDNEVKHDVLVGDNNNIASIGEIKLENDDNNNQHSARILSQDNEEVKHGILVGDNNDNDIPADVLGRYIYYNGIENDDDNDNNIDIAADVLGRYIYEIENDNDIPDVDDNDNDNLLGVNDNDNKNENDSDIPDVGVAMENENNNNVGNIDEFTFEIVNDVSGVGDGMNNEEAEDSSNMSICSVIDSLSNMSICSVVDNKS